MKKEKKDKIEELKNKLKELQELKEEYLAGWQRAKADFLNYKKEEADRIGELVKYGTEDLIFKILPILDNFDLAEKKISLKLKDNEYIKGVFQIKKQLHDLLKNQGIEEIKTIKENFDPNFHEVVAEINSKDKKSGVIVSEVQKGYTLHGKVIRPARVKVVK